jgi:hypothetical protein
MARDYARIMTAIWKNKEFRSLTEQQQRAYLFLVTQPDISAAGVLPLRVRRWADCASSSTPDGLAQLFKELEAGRFIVVDWDKEELLIRSFIRWDGGFNNPKRRPVIIRAAEEIDSEVISRHVAMEFKRCGIVTPPPDGPSGGAEPPIDPTEDREPDSLSKIDRVDLDHEPFPQVNSLSDSASTNHGRVPQPSTLNPQPLPPPTASAGATAPGVQLAVIQGGDIQAVVLTSQDAVAAWCDGFAETHDANPTREQTGQVGRESASLIKAGNPPERVVHAARTAGARGFATIRREYDALAKRRDAVHPTAHATPPRESTTDARVRAGLALAAKYEAQEAG